jgi:hypothetical protein
LQEEETLFRLMNVWYNRFDRAPYIARRRDAPPSFFRARFVGKESLNAFKRQTFQPALQ